MPDREPATVQAWLADQPQIDIVARDRGGGYSLAPAKALPKATQVADRWHLMENASRAFLDAVRKSMRPIRAAIGAATINPDLLTAAERLQYEEYVRREETNAAILGRAKEGSSIKESVRRTVTIRGGPSSEGREGVACVGTGASTGVCTGVRDGADGTGSSSDRAGAAASV